MKITIDNLRQDLFEVDSSTGKEIVGGDSISANASISAFSDNSFARASGQIFGFGSDLSGNLVFDVQTGNGFSKTSIFASVSSGEK